MSYGHSKITLSIGEYAPLFSQADHRVLQWLTCLSIRNPPLYQRLCK
jgi:hypothetical protein